MKRVLILGAGVYQIPLIRRCKELGLYTIVSSIPGNYPGFSYADRVYFENTVDQEAILALARQEKINAILTTGTDVAVSTIGRICDELGLCGVTKESALWVTNKVEMKERFHLCGVRTAEFRKVSSLEEACCACKEIGFPVIFKSVDMSGSRGISRVDSMDEIPTAFAYSIKNTHCSYILIERFLLGSEIGVDGYIGEDSCTVIPHDKLLYYNGATNVPVGHVFPYACTPELSRDIREQIQMAAVALELKRVFFNADVMICDGKSTIIEMGARCGATCIPELISAHFGVDYYELMIRNALGETITMPKKSICASVGELLRSETGGRITSIVTGPFSNQVDSVALDYQVGDMVRRFSVGPDRIGHVIVHGRDTADAFRALEEAKTAIQIEIR